MIEMTKIVTSEDLTDVLAKIANEIEKWRTTNPEDLNILLMSFVISGMMTDFFEDRSENLKTLYQNKLDFLPTM